MNKFEYKIVKNGNTNNTVEKELNNLGSEGWECFYIEKEYDDYLGSTYNYFLKRVIDDTDNVNYINNIMARWEINCDGWYPYCTNCGEEPNRADVIKNNGLFEFCPNCGAKMENYKEYIKENKDIK